VIATVSGVLVAGSSSKPASASAYAAKPKSILLILFDRCIGLELKPGELIGGYTNRWLTSTLDKTVTPAAATPSPVKTPHRHAAAFTLESGMASPSRLVKIATVRRSYHSSERLRRVPDVCCNGHVDRLVGLLSEGVVRLH
jgi:hypothetical protein